MPNVVALLRVADRVFERGLGQANAARGHVDPLALQPGHDLFETIPLAAADQVFRGHEEIVEGQLAGFDALIAQLVDIAADAKARGAFFDHEGRDAPMRRIGVRVGLGGQHESIAVPGIGDPHLRAVDPIAAVAARGGGPQPLHVGAGVGLRKGQASAALATGQPRQKPPPLLLGAKAVQNVANDRMRAEWSDDAHPTPGQFLDDHGERGRVQPQAAVFPRHIGAEQAQLLQSLDDFLGVFVVVFQLAGDRNDFPLDKRADALDDVLLHLRYGEHESILGE